MAKTYEKLTAFIPLLMDDKFGETILDTENDGSSEHPISIPYVEYTETVNGLIDAIYEVMDEHPDYGLDDYWGIMNENGIGIDNVSYNSVDVNTLGEKCILALLVWSTRGDGKLLSLLDEGYVQNLLCRLKEIDEMTV